MVKQTKRLVSIPYIGNYRRRILSHIAVTPTANQHQERTNLLKFAEPLTCTAQSQLDSPRMEIPHYA